jgi:hypothetical protein
MVERGVTILFGDGHGHFRGSDRNPTPAGPSPFAVAVGDVNGDGKPDLVVANYSGHIVDPSGDTLTFLLGDGRGNFRLGPRIPTGRAPGDAAVGDVDGDGIADAVVADAGSGDVTVAFGGPEGLSPSRTVRVPVGGQFWRILLADFDGNRRADLVTANFEAHTITFGAAVAARPAPRVSTTRAETTRAANEVGRGRETFALRGRLRDRKE